MNSVPTSKALRFQYTHHNKWLTPLMWCDLNIRLWNMVTQILNNGNEAILNFSPFIYWSLKSRIYSLFWRRMNFLSFLLHCEQNKRWLVLGMDLSSLSAVSCAYALGRRRTVDGWWVKQRWLMFQRHLHLTDLYSSLKPPHTVVGPCFKLGSLGIVKRCTHCP